ncbi:AraC family transcriptional regulator [Pseudomonas sp. GM48]|uniref:AraC family transcriptional regulator n=1 Tax=Pseudomonas sp. GM48 TaxID=1144330 RepID=UPI00026FD55F|nr:AraC family transcriptional regulator [Pseudomonas sp. GM48]EJM53195.1 DNA-binding domain-containing protein, AraC-type [Pseudomonas sp. GM48]
MSMTNAYDSYSALNIITRPGVGTTGVVLQQKNLEFKRLYIESPLLIYVEKGMKSVRWPGGKYLIRAGEAIVVAGGQSLDITNKLAEDGSYRAHWLVWDETLFASNAESNSDLPVIKNALPMRSDIADFADSLHRAIQAVEDKTVPPIIARHRLQELLVWVGVNGGRLEHSRPPTMTAKVRQLIKKDLAGEWSAETVASAFAMSEATMRRRLAEEGTNLSNLLIDARMSFALQLLQSTAQPVMQIALSVGYQTPSQFAVRFRDRFGFPPTAIRGHRRDS